MCYLMILDDIITGSNSVEEVFECQSQLIYLCTCAKFELRKWAGNNNEILKVVIFFFDLKEESELKVLELQWDSLTDTFSYKVQPTINTTTKRSVLSNITRVFDLSTIHYLIHRITLTNHLLDKIL